MIYNEIRLKIGKHTYIACFEGVKVGDHYTYGSLISDAAWNDATGVDEIDIDCWAITFKSKDNPKHTIEVHLGYDDEGNRDCTPYYAMVYDENGNEVAECVTVKLTNY